jgi:hypothetical protein
MSNLDAIFYLHVVPKFEDIIELQFPKWENYLEVLKFNFFYLWECVWVLKQFPNLFFLSYLSLGHKSKDIMTPNFGDYMFNIKKWKSI